MAQHVRTIADDRIYFVPAFAALVWAFAVIAFTFGYHNFTLTTFNIAMVAAWVVIPNYFIVRKFVECERRRLAA